MASGVALQLCHSSIPVATMSSFSCLSSEPELFKPKRLATRSQINSLRRDKQYWSAMFTGILGRLPAEILVQIFMQLDLRTLHSFQQVNSFCLRLVHDLPAYRLLREQASEALQIMHLADTACLFPLYQVFAELCQPRCRQCGDFGPYLFLLSCSRCCLQCLWQCDAYRLAPASEIATYLTLSESNLTTLLSIPGDYGPNKQRRRRRLASYSAALDLSRKLYANRIRVEKQLLMWPPPNGFRTLRTHHWYERLLYSRTKNWRFMGATPFPFWDRQTQTLEPGTYCGTCMLKDPYNQLLLNRPSYITYPPRARLMSEMPQHFLTCASSSGLISLNDRRWHKLFRTESCVSQGQQFFVRANGSVEGISIVKGYDDAMDSNYS